MATLEERAARVRPSGWWYVLVPLLAVLGIVGGVLAAVEEGREVAESFRLLGEDRRGSIDLEAGDEATVWAVWQDGRDDPERPAAAVLVRGPAGEPVAFRPRTNGETTFSFGHESGVDLGTFVARDAGRHELAVTWQDGAVRGAAPAAGVGVLDLSGLVDRVVRPIWLGVLAATVLFVVLMVLRGRAKRRIGARAAGHALESSTPVRPAAGAPPDQRGPIRFE